MSEASRQGRRTAAVEALVSAYDPEPSHSRQDARLALRMFDETLDLHGLGGGDRELLEAAARLHDIGWSVAPGGSGHHKRSYDLIVQNGLDGFTEEETLVVALVARYHRRALPRPSHRGMARLSESARGRVARMAALLRIADGLDRTHRSVVGDLNCRMEAGVLVVEVRSRRGPEDEIAAALKKADLSKKVFRMDLRVEVVA